MRVIRFHLAEIVSFAHSPHFWAISLLAFLAAITHYYNFLDLTLLPFGTNLLTYVTFYSLHYLLILLPMLYAASVFYLRGAIFFAVVVFFAALSHNLFTQAPLPETILEFIVWSISAMAAVLLAMERTEKRHQKAMLRQLDALFHQLETDTKLLQTSETRYRGLFDSASEGIVVRDLQGNIIEANQAMANLSGYSRQELSTMNVLKDLCPENASLLLGRQQLLLENKAATQRYEVELIRKDGTRRNIESLARLINEDGKPIGVQAMLRDVTEQRQMEAALRKSEEQYRSLVEGTHVGIGTLDPGGSLTFVNESLCQMVGYSQEELLGKFFADFLHPGDRPEIMRVFGQAPTSSKDNVYLEFSAIHREGRMVYVGATASVIKHDNELVGFNLVIVNITDRKLVEKALKESEDKLHSLYFTISEGVCLHEIIHDESGTAIDYRITDVNPAYESITGLSRESAVGSKASELYGTGEPPYLNTYAEVVSSGKPVSFDIYFEPMSKYLSISATSMGKGRFATVFSDITERKRVEEELKHSEQRLRILFEFAPDAYALCDLSGKIIDANRMMQEITGRKPDELIGINFAELGVVSPEQIPKGLAGLRKYVFGESTTADEYVINRKVGSPVIVERRTFPVKIRGQTMLLVIAHDITDRKLAEMALRDSQEFTSSLLNNFSYPVLVVNPDTTIRYVNPALEKLTGFAATEVVGNKAPYPWWVNGAEGTSTRNSKKTTPDGVTRLQELFLKKNGEQFWVEITSTPVRSEGQIRYYLATWVDITERKRLEENMEFYIAEITRAQEEERKRVARELHDETAQSLSLLSLNIDAVLRDREKLPKNAVKRLEQLRSETKTVVDEVRRFCYELRPGVLDMGLVPALELLTQDLTANGIDTYLEILGDERRLQSEAEVLMFRITQEALRNVRKHSRATEAAVTVDFDTDKVGLIVSDNGDGCRLPGAIDELASKGKLGIIGMRERAHLLGADFSIKSEVGKGTTITVELTNRDE
ncbi:MAG: PAS domain S-box protein [Chloroflexi bacterium]|nr:PAS domain S-box protein [Chloroflexota bacterium]